MEEALLLVGTEQAGGLWLGPVVGAPCSAADPFRVREGYESERARTVQRMAHHHAHGQTQLAFSRKRPPPPTGEG